MSKEAFLGYVGFEGVVGVDTRVHVHDRASDEGQLGGNDT
jgi:hypothetical protein